MRLFIAINFSDRFRQALSELTEQLAARAISARPTEADNYHLTLAFLGEQDERQLQAAARAVDSAAANSRPFTVKSGRLGCFRRDEGDLWWLGLQKQPLLDALQADLSKRLQQTGFAVEKRPFRPHLTLLRKACFPPDFDLDAASSQLPVWFERVFRLSLMESCRVGGRLVYVERHGHDLGTALSAPRSEQLF